MSISKISLGFIGFGHMAQVIAGALLKTHRMDSSQLFFTRRDREKAQQDEKKYQISFLDTLSLAKQTEYWLIGVRPNQLGSLVNQIPMDLFQGKKILSVLAGVPLSALEKIFVGAEVLRIMPNTPSEVGEGLSLFSFSKGASSSFQTTAKELFLSMGKVIEIEEAQMDIGCGMSGSGPGFVFRLIEAVAKVGEKEGIAYPKALEIAAQTFLGAAKLILEGGHFPQDLLSQIATPGGTTQAGLEKMTELQLDRHLQEVVVAAAMQSAALAKAHLN